MIKNAGIGLPEEMIARLRELANKQDLTVSKLVQNILGEYIASCVDEHA